MYSVLCIVCTVCLEHKVKIVSIHFPVEVEKL